jgi:hypothetical protein
MTQDEAAKRIGVSKVHINLVVQALNSKNARVIKMLENPELTRGQLHEDLVECGIIRASSSPTPTSKVVLSAAAASNGLNSLFSNRSADDPGDDDDLLGDDVSPPSEEGVDLDHVLGDPPSANGKVITFKPTSAGGMPVVGSKPGHPERRPKDTPASLLAEKFKGFTEADKISFMQLTWHLQRKLLKVAGLAADSDTPKPVSQPAATAAAAGEVAKSAIAKAGKSAKAAKPAKAA